MNSSKKSQSSNDNNGRVVKGVRMPKDNRKSKSGNDSRIKSTQKNTSKQSSSQLEQYQNGNNVDALCIVQNGSKRWYPGTVIGCNIDGSFQIKFLDGEIKSNVITTEMRLTKKRNPNLNKAVKVDQISTMSKNNEENSEFDNLQLTSSTNDSNIHVISEKIGRSLSKYDLNGESQIKESDSSESLVDLSIERKISTPIKSIKQKKIEPSYMNPTSTSQSKTSNKNNKQETIHNNLFKRNAKSTSELQITSSAKADDMSVNSVKSDASDEIVDVLSEKNSEEGGSDDDRIFTIPSVFKTINSEGKEENVVRTASVKEGYYYLFIYLNVIFK